jgi:hypothetical protein
VDMGTPSSEVWLVAGGWRAGVVMVHRAPSYFVRRVPRPDRILPFLSVRWRLLVVARAIRRHVQELKLLPQCSATLFFFYIYYYILKTQYGGYVFETPP